MVRRSNAVILFPECWLRNSNNLFIVQQGACIYLQQGAGIYLHIILGVVHILRNHFWGSRETPPPLCYIIIIWAYSPHTSYLSFFLHEQNFWRIKFTPKKRVNYSKIHSKLPIFRVKSLKNYTGQKNLHEHIRGVRDKYQVWVNILLLRFLTKPCMFHTIK